MRVVFTATALEDIARLPRAAQKRIVTKLEYFCMQDNPLAAGKPLTGYHGFYRFRIGAYRVVVRPSGITMIVHTVDKRDKAYQDL